jgi:hypothetical protein
MAKKKKTTITINAKKVPKDKVLMAIINEYADEVCKGMEPKIALGYFIKTEMAGKIAELKKKKAANG